ncbi:ZIP zinc/iron transport family [Wilcoxina mikolae CBS 423.85]|nr:ZIP zinc/iron transport family [Wilcoxina mikolae CBS 423.85]
MADSLDIQLVVDKLIRRQDAPISCATGNNFNGGLGLRIASVFVILFSSSFGAFFPIIAKNNPSLRIPPWAFFFAKYFGSGVIVATAFIHLLSPSNQALTNPCLTGVITEYPWSQGIALISLFALFFVEILAMRYATFSTMTSAMELETSAASGDLEKRKVAAPAAGSSTSSAAEPHFSHTQDHQEIDDIPAESYASQLTSIFILEFGVVFHSIFIGLTLAVSGNEFNTLFIVLTFHQMFEGLGLGSRLATVSWPAAKLKTPYIMALAYGLSTPLAIAVGLGVRKSYPPEGATTLVVSGIFDALSAGILLYTGLVELMAHEFLFSHALRKASTQTVFSAFGIMCLGAMLMALLGKWA